MTMSSNGTDTATREDTLVLSCCVCHKPVSEGTGYICVNDGADLERREAIKEWESRNPGPGHLLSAFADYSDLIPWHIYHEACDPNSGRDDLLADGELVQHRNGSALLDSPPVDEGVVCGHRLEQLPVRSA